LNMCHTAVKFVSWTLNKWSKAATRKRVSWPKRER
jgi:hypothetical protein